MMIDKDKDLMRLEERLAFAMRESDADIILDARYRLGKMAEQNEALRSERDRLREALDKLCKSLRHPIYGRADFECDSAEHEAAERLLEALKR